MNYKYVVVGYGYDYYYYVYRQLNEMEDAVFVSNWPVSKISNRVFYYILRFNLSFLKSVLIKSYVHFFKRTAKRQGFNDSDKLCFLLLAGGANNRLLEFGLCEKIRKSFINSKVVFFINDLVSKTHQPVDLMREHADLVYSFDPLDCSKYGLLNHCIPYSDCSFHNHSEPKYDVAFVGAAKDRLKEILSIFFYLSERGVKCLFNIIGVSQEEQIPAEGIVYSGRITYEENLKLLQESNCIIDIIQGNSSGNTIRVGEAVIMGKKLLTNNKYTPQNGIFDEKYMRVFQFFDDIDISFLKDRTPVNYKIKEKIYPADLLRCIDNKLSNE